MFNINKYSKIHVSNLCPRQGAGGVQCCAKFISNKISIFALKKFIFYLTYWQQGSNGKTEKNVKKAKIGKQMGQKKLALVRKQC